MTDIQRHVHQTAYLNGGNSRSLTDKREAKSPSPRSFTFHEPDGIIDVSYMDLNKTPRRSTPRSSIPGR